MGAGSLWGAQPVLSNLALDEITHTSVRVKFTSSIVSKMQIRFGTSSGSYPYRSYTMVPLEKDSSLVLNALAPATTFYLRLAARPNYTSDVEICDSDACGSTELTFTTLPEPAVHPAPPVQPYEFNANQPDTDGYVTLTVSQLSGGTCNLQQLIDSASYGTVIELPQGMVCNTDNLVANDRRGWSLKGKPLDPNAGGDINSPNHRWIIIRTANGPVDLPPSGVRVTPQTAAPFAKLVAQRPVGAGGEVFYADTYNGTPHHYRIETLEITHTDSPALFPPDAVDPAPMNSLITMFAHVSTTTIPNYFYFDRLYIHGLGFPGRLKSAIWLNGKFCALTNSYIDKVDYWRPYQFPDAPPTLSVNRLTLTAPSKSYRRNQNDVPWTMGGTATAQLQADPSYSGTFYGSLGADGLTIEYTDSALATINCTNCNAVKKATPASPYNRYYWFSGTIANGQFTITITRNAVWETSLYATEGSSGIYTTDGAGPYLIENNFLEAYGIGYFIDGPGAAAPNPSDIVFRRNHVFWNQNHRTTSATSNGFYYSVRNMWEIKRGARIAATGNLYEGTWANVTQGTTVFVSNRPANKVSFEQGSRDVTIKHNLIRNASAGFYCQGTSDIWSSPPATERVLIANNLLYGIDQFEQNVNSPNGIGDNIRILNGCHDVTVRNNTFGSNVGRRPTQLSSGAGLWNEGLAFVDNLMYLNLGDGNGGGLSIDGTADANHPYAPPMPSGNYKSNLDRAYLRIGAAVESNYTFTNNVIGGGVKGASKAALTDITASEMTSYKSQYPAGNFFPDGATRAQREAPVKWMDIARNNYRLRPDSPYRAGGANPATNGKDIGVNQDELEAEMGIVTNIAPVAAGSNSATFSYTAPDGRGCWLETSPDQFATFTRTHDGGGNRARVVTIQGLLAGAVYTYRILCYFEQFNDSLHPAFPADQNTNGTFTTLAGGGVAGSLAVAVAPPASLGVDHVVAEYGATNLLGTSTSPVSCGGGCTVEIPVSSSQLVYYRLRYRDGGGTVLRSGAVETAIPRL
jgi:hypothetical protein